MISVEACLLEQFRERAFERRFEAFVQDYDLGSKPALVFQAMPLESLAIDIKNHGVLNAIQEGAGAISESGWWYGFKAGGRPVLVFDGLASSSKTSEHGWASEVHVDGHVVAGLWTFPDAGESGQTSRPAVASFFTHAFRDFGFFTRSVHEATPYSGSVALSCTMLQANELPLIASRGNTISPAVKRPVLRWPLQIASGLADIDAVCGAMAVRFMRAYGKNAELW
jgi:hypothetical protein